ncbi:hypothetical protein Bpfe_017169 [Biomphalaria pfeifferi]|uniref:Uncharacterized protein n=1 Tax=Biomphalaria pfeifferi TaxID=112525 RepID=A0AAD8BF59_BIOPF|nr:hypothetical protein Bpfe_017169 [Biomphalaria pfeifferi]
MHSGSAVFLATHGQLGHLAADYARAVPDTLRGLILLGAVLPKRVNVIAFPLPVLTIVGEIDGVTRITRVSETLHAMMRSVKFDPELAIQSPLIILEGSNHDVFITGSLPFSLYQHDIEAEVPKSVAMETAANFTALFLAHVLQEPEVFVKTAATEFKKAFEAAQNMTAPIESLREATINNLKSYWVKSAQKWLSGLTGKQSTQIEVDSYVEKSQDGLPPTMIYEHGVNHIVTFSEVIRYADKKGKTEDDGSLPQAPDEIAAKMLGPERIQASLKNATRTYNYTCRDLNYASFMTAYHTATERARIRFDGYHRGVIFQPDIVTNSEALWESTHLKFNVHASKLYVTSIAYKTPMDDDLGVESGLFFCKLLPPDRAMEWIYVDSISRDMSF